MGLLVDGVWHDKWYDTKSSDGKFKREDAQLRNWVTADGSAGPTGVEGFKAESRTLSPICFTGVSMGAQNLDIQEVERSGGAYFRFNRQPGYAR